MSIEITPFGIFFLPLLLATLGRPGRVLPLVVFASIFDAASVLNLQLGSFIFGVQPAFAAALVFIAAILLRWISGQTFGNEGRVLYLFQPLVLFCLAASLSALALPKLFAGQVYVWPQRIEKGLENVSVPLYPASGNTTQMIYLIIAVLLAVIACAYVEARRDMGARLLKTYFVCGLVACAIAVWQWTGKVWGVIFPQDFFFSNPTWADNTDQVFGSAYRISGTFAEPSFLCFYLAGVLYASAWKIMSTGPSRLAVATFLASLVVTILSTSTTGYGVIALGAPLLVLFGTRTRGALPRIFLGAALAAPVLIVLAAVIWRSFPQLVQIGTEIVSETLSKSDSVSYEIRSRQDHDSYALVFETFGLGAGWGSVRASSLVATMVGATGIWGAALLAWLSIRVARSWRRARALAGPGSSFEPLAASIIGMLVAAALSKPDLVFSGFWVNLGAAAAMALSLRARAASALPTAIAGGPVPPSGTAAAAGPAAHFYRNGAASNSTMRSAPPAGARADVTAYRTGEDVERFGSARDRRIGGFEGTKTLNERR